MLKRNFEMEKIRQSIITSLTPVLKKYSKIAFAYLFGSVATEEQNQFSDVDVAIFHYPDVDFSFDNILQFQGDCCRILKRNDVDILLLNKARNLILLDDVIRKGRIILNREPQLLNDFELKTLHQVCDFKYQRNREMGV